jgi:hypothetical protein
MIQHHSIAVHMSKKLLEKENNISPLLEKIIKNQQDELLMLKMMLIFTLIRKNDLKIPLSESKQSISKAGGFLVNKYKYNDRIN